MSKSPHLANGGWHDGDLRWLGFLLALASAVLVLLLVCTVIW